MSLHYLLDGYNILHQMPASAVPARLADERDKLTSFVDIFRPQGSLANEVTIVFDGRPGLTRPASASGTTIIFSGDESADDRIVKMVTEASYKKRMIVVTDDRNVRFAVRACGARIMAVEEFLARLPKSREKSSGKKAREKEADGTKYISKTLEAKITAEFENIWLKKKRE